MNTPPNISRACTRQAGQGQCYCPRGDVRGAGDSGDRFEVRVQGGWPRGSASHQQQASPISELSLRESCAVPTRGLGVVMAA